MVRADELIITCYSKFSTNFCSIFELVRAHFATAGGEAAPLTISSFSLVANS